MQSGSDSEKELEERAEQKRASNKQRHQGEEALLTDDPNPAEHSLASSSNSEAIFLNSDLIKKNPGLFAPRKSRPGLGLFFFLS